MHLRRGHNTLERINKGHVVFFTENTKKQKLEIYISQDKNNGNHSVVGIVTKNFDKREHVEPRHLNKSGLSMAQYIGVDPIIGETLYLIESYNGTQYNGTVSVLRDPKALPLKKDDMFYKIGTVTNNVMNGGLVPLNIDIEQTINEHYDTNTIEKLPTTNIDKLSFSFYDIGKILNDTMNNETVILALNALKNAFHDQLTMHDIAEKVHEYSHAIVNNLTVDIETEYSGYYPRIVTCFGSGLVTYDSAYVTKESNPTNIISTDITVIDYNTNYCTIVPLVPGNPTGLTQFHMLDTLTSRSVHPFIDTTADSGKWQVLHGSSYLMSFSALSETQEAISEGCGCGARYCHVTDRHNYNVSIRVPLTDTYNIQNGEILIVRLGFVKA